MTQGAKINLPVPGKSRRVYDCCLRGGLWRWLRTVAGSVPAARTMTFLTRDPQHQTGLVIPVQGRRERLEGGCVTFKTARGHALAEKSRPIPVSRTVHPFIQANPVRDRELKELATLPKQIGLAFPRGANNDIKALCSINHVRRGLPHYRRLEKALFGRVHFKKQI